MCRFYSRDAIHSRSRFVSHEGLESHRVASATLKPPIPGKHWDRGLFMTRNRPVITLCEQSMPRVRDPALLRRHRDRRRTGRRRRPGSWRPRHDRASTAPPKRWHPTRSPLRPRAAVDEVRAPPFVERRYRRVTASVHNQACDGQVAPGGVHRMSAARRVHAITSASIGSASV